MLGQDLRYALRLLWRSPGFTVVAVLTLALGIGANTVMFSVVDGMILNPFPYPEPDRLVGVGTEYPRLNRELAFWEVLSPAEYQDIETQSRTLERVVAWDMGNRQIAGEEAHENVLSAFWWGDAFKTLGVSPVLGRGFLPEEVERRDRVAVISHRLWQRRFGGDPELVGSTLHVNGVPYTVVGIMPRRTLIYGTDLWIPMPVGPEIFPRQRRQFQVLARLAPGVTLEEANAELEGIARRIEEEYSNEHEEYSGWHLRAHTWTAINVRLLRPAALILMGAVGFVLALVCANIANLLLARSARRRQELAVRSAMGAGRWRLLGQLQTESLVVALLGGLAGVGLAVLGVRGIVAALSLLPVPLPGEVALNHRVLLFTVLVSLGAGLLFGLVPALQASRSNLQAVLKVEGAGTIGGHGRHRLQRVFVGVEVALALILLVGGGLLIHSFVRLQRVEPGFDTRHVLTMRLTLPWEEYEGDQITVFFRELTERVAALPGVRATAAGSQYPPVTFLRSRFSIADREPVAEGALPSAYTTQVDDAYFHTLGIPLLRGRLPDERDREDGPPVVAINQEVARRFFPGQDPIGQRIKLGGADAEGRWLEIVGVVAAVHNLGLDREPQPELFFGLRQARGSSNQLFLLVRTTVEPRTLLPAVRGEVRALDADQPIYAVQTIDEAFALEGTPRRIATLALTLFAAFALVLAAVGIYGVVSYAAAERTREIGIRIAMGARAPQVRRLVLRQALLPLTIGAVAGLAAAAALARLMASLLFEVSGTDPLTLLAVAGVLFAVALLASYLPARRASRLDPVQALRSE